jgi:hypothetical protein
MEKEYMKAFYQTVCLDRISIKLAHQGYQDV